MAQESESEAMVGFLDVQENRVGLIILAALFLPFALMVVFSGIYDAAGFDDYRLFCCREDRFADLLKAGMSYKQVMTQLSPDDVATWPELYRGFLNATPGYAGFPLTHYAMTPLGALSQVSSAELIVLFGPTATLIIAILFYATCAAATAILLRRLFPNNWMDQVAALSVLLFSYPVLFMADRANFPAGLTTLALALYVLTSLKGQYRWLGILGLAVAINLRPNTACFGLLELVVASRPGDLIYKILGAAALTLVVGGLSYPIVQVGDPVYSYKSFMKAYQIYNIAYVQGAMGFPWNFSLYGTTRFLRDLFGFSPPYSADCYSVVSVLAMLSGAVVVLLATMRKLTVVTAAFLATCLSALFTPVFAFYHMTEFAVPLLAILAAKGTEMEIRPDHKLIFVTCLLCLCPLDAEHSLYPIVIAGVMGVVMFRAVGQAAVPSEAKSRSF